MVTWCHFGTGLSTGFGPGPRFHKDCGAPISDPARFQVIFQTGRVGDRRSGGRVRLRLFERVADPLAEVTRLRCATARRLEEPRYGRRGREQSRPRFLLDSGCTGGQPQRVDSPDAVE